MATQTAGKVYQFPRSRIVAPAPARSIELLARVGLGAKGLAYMIAGVMALAAAVAGSRGAATAADVLATLGRVPLAAPMLWVASLGLDCYVVWRLVQALLDPDHKGATGRGVAQRCGMLVSALLNFWVAYLTARVASLIASGHYAAVSDLVTWHLGSTWGPVLGAALGLVLLVFGVQQIYEARRGAFMKEYEFAMITMKERASALKLGEAAYVARGALALVGGWLLIVTAEMFDPQAGHGLVATLIETASGPSGIWLYLLAALCFGTFGGYCMTRARYRRFDRRR